MGGGIRPASNRDFKPPYVGSGGGGAGADELVKISATDTTEDYLDDKITAGAGVTTTILNPGGNEELEISVAGADLIDEGMGVNIYTNNDSQEEINGLPRLNEDFTDATLRPFWLNSPPITSGDWELDAPNDYLEGIAENNTNDIFRPGVEGDFDLAGKFTRNTATSAGFYVIGALGSIRFYQDSAKFVVVFPGHANLDIVNTDSTYWLRIRRIGNTFTFWYKIADLDAWTLAGTYADENHGQDVDLSLDSADTTYLHRLIIYDNVSTQAMRSIAPKVQDLTDAATIAVDASLGNEFRVILGGNRTLGAPTNPIDGQLILFKIEQDGTGTRTLAYNGIYRFSTDIPSPTLSTGAGDIDLLGFRYDADDTKWDLISLVQGF